MTLSKERRQILEARLGYVFKNPQLLETALCHSSYINECHDGVSCNERLEFLGDAVVNLVVARILMTFMPTEREGQLSAVRSVLVSEKGLAEVAVKLGLPQMLVLGKGEDRDGGREKDSLLSDAMEAVFGAVFLDSDYETVQQVIQTILARPLQAAMDNKNSRDYKTMLQEYLQNKKLPLPVYELVSAAGPDHKKLFTMRLCIDNLNFEGSGPNKKQAQQDAAHNAMAYFARADALKN